MNEILYAHIFPPLDQYCAFDTSSSRTLKKSHTTLLVAMVVQNTELDKKTYQLLNSEHSYYILNEKGVYDDRLVALMIQ